MYYYVLNKFKKWKKNKKFGKNFFEKKLQKKNKKKYMKNLKNVIWRHVASYDVTWIMIPLVRRHMTSCDVIWRHCLNLGVSAVFHFEYILSQSRDQVLKTALLTTLTKNIPKNNYSKIYFYYDCNRPKWDLQINILQVYIII